MRRISPEPSSGFCVTTASALAALVAAVAATAIATAAAVATISGAGAGSSLATAIFIAAVLAAAASGLLAACIAGPPVPTEASNQIVLPLTTVQDGLKTLMHISKARSQRPTRQRPPTRRRPLPEHSAPPPPPKQSSPPPPSSFHERCGRILQTCDLLVRHFPASRTLCILRTAEGIIARRPHRPVEPEPTWESDVDVDLDPVLSAPNLDEALRRLDLSIRSAKKYKERNERLQSTPLVLEAEKRRTIRSAEQYLIDDVLTPGIRPPSSITAEDIPADADFTPKPKARSSLLQPIETHSSHHLPSPETQEILSEDTCSSRNDVPSSFVEMIPEESVAFDESDISSSSCVKETENVALNPTEIEELPQETMALSSTLLEDEPPPSILTEIDTVSTGKVTEIALTSTDNDEVLSAVKTPESEVLPVILDEDEAASSSLIVEVDNEAPLQDLASSTMVAEIEESTRIVEPEPSSSGVDEASGKLTDCSISEVEEVQSSSIVLDTEIMPVCSTQAEDSLLPIIEEADDALPLSAPASSSSASASLSSTEITSSTKPIPENLSEEAAFTVYPISDEPEKEVLDISTNNEPDSPAEPKTESLLQRKYNVVAEAENQASDILPDLSMNSESYLLEPYTKKADNLINNAEKILADKPTEISTPKTSLTLDLESTPSGIDQAFEQLLQTISPPTDDIDKTFSDVSLELDKRESNYQTEIIASPSDHLIPEEPSQEAQIARTTETLISDIKPFLGLDVLQSRQEGSDYVDENVSLKAESLADIHKEDIQYPKSNLDPVKIFFEVLNSQQGAAVCEPVVELQSDSLNEGETNFDREIQSFIKDNLGAEVISDCASDSSSMSVSPNPEISFFTTQTNSAPEAGETPKKINEDLKKMDEFGFGEPLMIVTARKVRTYVDDAEQFQKRLERRKRRLRIYPEDLETDSCTVVRSLKEPESSQFEPIACPRDTSTCKRLEPEAFEPFSVEVPASKNVDSSPCSDALPGHFFRSLERREERRLTTYDHSSEFPLNMRVPHRRAFWDNKVTEPKSESPKRQPSIKVTGIVMKCKESLQTPSTESLSTVTMDEEELPQSHRRTFQEAKCFFQNLEQGNGKAPAAVAPQEVATPEAVEKPRGYPATVEERFKVTGIYRDVLGDGAAKTATGAPLRGVPRRKAVIATLDSFRK